MTISKNTQGWEKGVSFIRPDDKRYVIQGKVSPSIQQYTSILPSSII